MCGLYGFISRDGEGPNIKRLKRLAAAVEPRGRHAHGASWIDSRGRLSHFKTPGRLTDNLDLLEQTRGCRTVAVHLRYSTSGDPLHNHNNHPIACDGGWIMHNGTIPNFDEMVMGWGLWLSSDCDSEAIARVIENADENKLIERVVQGSLQVEAYSAIVGMWARRSRVIIARRGRSLYYGTAPEGMYYASVRKGLPGPSKRWANNLAKEYAWTAGGKSYVARTCKIDKFGKVDEAKTLDNKPSKVGDDYAKQFNSSNAQLWKDLEDEHNELNRRDESYDEADITDED